ncbi:MAG: DNA-processing protein DprA [Saccharofermentans sp.]|nr:DNA-processing protein DprA [Saccharofermentans sp.]
MNIDEINDYGYTAVKLISGIKSSVVDELLESGIIGSHRELIPDNINNILKMAGSLPLSSKTLNGLGVIMGCLDECKKAADDYINRAQKNGIRAVSCYDKEYPYPWRHLSGMPRVIFTKGNTNLLMDIFTSGCASIVGSRKPGKYSLYATEDFTKGLVSHGVVVISGLALGIDGKAHSAAMDNGGKTIAVTPGGPDVHYPYQHEALYNEIYEKGLVISEMPPGQGIIKQYFPSRNRLIAALSDVCLIMEAGKYSGTLHTASFAGAQGKDVFVLPNGIYYENGIGGLLLIRDGAEVLIDIDTVLERIKGNVITRVKEDGANFPELLSCDGDMARMEEDLLKKMKVNPNQLSTEEWKQVIKSFIEEKPRNFDELSVVIPLDIGRLMSYLTELELSSEVDIDRDKYVLTIQKT